MSNEEHLLENILIRYTRTGDSSKESAKKDPNWYECEDPDSIYNWIAIKISSPSYSRAHLETFFPSCQSKLQDSSESYGSLFVI